MQLKMKFYDGPMHGKVGLVPQLLAHQIFHDTHNKSFIVYARDDELTYKHDADLSATLTGMYDKALANLDGGTGNNVSKFEYKTFA